MRSNKFQMALDRFKSREKPEAVLLVASHKEYATIAAAWMHCDVTRRRRAARCPDKSDADIWAWLWENTRFSADTLRAASGVSKERFGQRLEALIGSHTLYPDGTVNSFVRRYLRERVLRLLGVDAKTRRALKRTCEGATVSSA